jgi:hypothetical protein
LDLVRSRGTHLSTGFTKATIAERTLVVWVTPTDLNEQASGELFRNAAPVPSSAHPAWLC